MGITNFIIVILVNTYWIVKGGWIEYKEMFSLKGIYPRWFAIGVWAYLSWGIFNLIYEFY